MIFNIFFMLVPRHDLSDQDKSEPTEKNLSNILLFQPLFHHCFNKFIVLYYLRFFLSTWSRFYLQKRIFFDHLVQILCAEVDFFDPLVQILFVLTAYFYPFGPDFILNFIRKVSTFLIS